jgi:hypothetical protein
MKRQHRGRKGEMSISAMLGVFGGGWLFDSAGKTALE